MSCCFIYSRTKLRVIFDSVVVWVSVTYFCVALPSSSILFEIGIDEINKMVSIDFIYFFFFFVFFYLVFF